MTQKQNISDDTTGRRFKVSILNKDAVKGIDMNELVKSLSNYIDKPAEVKPEMVREKQRDIILKHVTFTTKTMYRLEKLLDELDEFQQVLNCIQ